MDNITDSELMLNERHQQIDQASSQFRYISNVSSIVEFILFIALIYVTTDSGWPVFLGLLIVSFVCEKIIMTIHLRKFNERLGRINDEWLSAILESKKKPADL